MVFLKDSTNCVCFVFQAASKRDGQQAPGGTFWRRNGCETVSELAGGERGKRGEMEIAIDDRSPVCCSCYLNVWPARPLQCSRPNACWLALELSQRIIWLVCCCGSRSSNGGGDHDGDGDLIADRRLLASSLLSVSPILTLVVSSQSSAGWLAGWRNHQSSPLLSFPPVQ